MTKKTIFIAALLATTVVGSMRAQTESGAVPRDYFPKTKNVVVVAQVEESPSDSASAAEQEKPKQDFISRNFKYISMCDWTPGMRFMVLPTQKDLIIKTFAEKKTGNMVSSKSLEKKIMVYDGHGNDQGSLHEQVYFHVENQPNEVYYFEVPTAKFDDYCYGKVGVPALAYLGDVDKAQDLLVGKRVRVLVRDMLQDTGTDGLGYKPVDIGDERRNTIMTITKVGVGTRNFPVKIIVQEANKKDGSEGDEFFQFVTISRTNCGYRSDELEIDDMKLHTFEGSFQLLDDKMSVGREITDAYVGKQFYTFFPTKMRNSSQNAVDIERLTTFIVKDIYRLGNSEIATLTLKDVKSGEEYTKEVSMTNTKVDGSEEVIDELFVEGDPEKIEGVKKANLPYIRRQQVKKGFTEAEVRLALGEPTDVTRTTADIYQWTYMFKNDKSRPFRAVKFSYKTKTVAQDMTK